MEWVGLVGMMVLFRGSLCMTLSIRRNAESRRFLERFEIDRIRGCGRSGDGTGTYLGPARCEDLLR